MINPDAYIQLALDRHRERLVLAETHRLIEQAPHARRDERSERPLNRLVRRALVELVTAPVGTPSLAATNPRHRHTAVEPSHVDNLVADNHLDAELVSAANR